MTKSRHFPSPVTAMFARQVKPGYEAEYEQWLGGISKASSEFPGNQGTTILKPSGARQEYIAITQFETAECLERWLCSKEREQWLEKLNAIALDHEEVEALTGMERWFTLPNRAVSQPPARYKTATLVFLGLYPLLLGLNLILDPFTRELPFPARLLISLVISIPLMAWFVSPWLTKLFFRWLYPGHRQSGLTRED